MSYVSPQSLKDILNSPHEYVNGAYRPLPLKPTQEINPPAPAPQGEASKAFMSSMEKNKKSKE